MFKFSSILRDDSHIHGFQTAYVVVGHKITTVPQCITSASDPAAGLGGRGARNMKSMWPPLAAIFFMTCLYRAGGTWPPRHPPGSATELSLLAFIGSYASSYKAS